MLEFGVAIVQSATAPLADMRFLKMGGLTGGALLAVLLLSAVCIEALHRQGAEVDAAAAKATLVYIGTYTGTTSRGIYAFRLQSAGSDVFQNVTLVPLGLAAETPNPSFLELDVKRRLLFAVNEIDQFEGKQSGAVSAYSIDAAGTLTLLNQRPSMGTRPCHLTVDTESRHLLVANCGSASIAVLPIGGDGRLGEATGVVPHAGQSISLDPAGRFAFACDPGSDKVSRYSFDAQRGTFGPGDPASIPLTAGAGPRLMTFRPDGRFAYLLNERNSTITAFAYDATAGRLSEMQTVSTLPEYFDGANVAGELRIHRSGKWLYVSNSGHNSVVLFTIDAGTGALKYVEEQGTGGRNPRYFGIEPSSKHLAISNRDSDTVLASRVDEGNGRLKPSGIFAAVASPASIRFLPPAESGR